MQKFYHDPELGSRLILTDSKPLMYGEDIFKILCNRRDPLTLDLDARHD